MPLSGSCHSPHIPHSRASAKIGLYATLVLLPQSAYTALSGSCHSRLICRSRPPSARRTTFMRLREPRNLFPQLAKLTEFFPLLIRTLRGNFPLIPHPTQVLTRYWHFAGSSQLISPRGDHSPAASWHRGAPIHGFRAPPKYFSPISAPSGRIPYWIRTSRS